MSPLKLRGKTQCLDEKWPELFSLQHLSKECLTQSYSKYVGLNTKSELKEDK